MKHSNALIAIVAIFLFGLSLVACSKQDTQPATQGNNPQATQQLKCPTGNYVMDIHYPGMGRTGSSFVTLYDDGSWKFVELRGGPYPDVYTTAKMDSSEFNAFKEELDAYDWSSYPKVDSTTTVSESTLRTKKDWVIIESYKPPAFVQSAISRYSALAQNCTG